MNTSTAKVNGGISSEPVNSLTAITSLKQVTDLYNQRLKEIMGGDNKNYRPLELGVPNDILLSAGLPDLPIQMAVQRLIDKKVQVNHPFSLLSVFSLPEYLSDPIAVFNSKTIPGRKVLLTEMVDKEVNLIIAIEPFKLKGHSQVNDIRSIYPKDNFTDILRWVVEEELHEYCHKQKVLNWLIKQQSNSAEVDKLIKDTTNVINRM